MNNDQIFNLVLFELGKAKEKHPVWPTDPVYAGAIVCEEFGELMRAIVQFKGEGGDIPSMIIEAVQTAAMCFRFLNNIDNYKR